MNLNCMIVDDDPMSRQLVKKYIEKTEFLSLQFECEDALTAINKLGQKDADIDIIFLDVEMPGMTGMEMIKAIGTNLYEIILITSQQGYAVEAFESSVTDYLVKPFDYNRFIKATNKAKEQIDALNKKNQLLDEIYVKSDSKLIRLGMEDILYIEALADYVIFMTVKGKYIVHHTMKGIEKRLPNTKFMRVHRSYIINRYKIDMIEDYNVVIGDKYIPVGTSYKERFTKSITQL